MHTCRDDTATAPPVYLTDGAADAEPGSDTDADEQPAHPDDVMPDRPLDDTAAVATSPTRGWFGHVGLWAHCASTGVWSETTTASQQRGNNLHRRAAKEQELRRGVGRRGGFNFCQCLSICLIFFCLFIFFFFQLFINIID